MTATRGRGRTITLSRPMAASTPEVADAQPVAPADQLVAGPDVLADVADVLVRPRWRRRRVRR